MAQLVKVIGAVLASIGTITGITVSTTNSTPPPALTTNSSSSTPQEVTNLRDTETTKKGYYVLADWGNTQWKVKSDKFSKLNEWNNKELKFSDVEMYIGEKKLEKGYEFTTQRNSRKYVLYERKRGVYKLENGKELIIGELRNQWDTLGVTKYDEEPLRKWQKPISVSDYDIEFDTCKFTQVKGQNTDNKDTKIKVTCQVGWPRQTIWRELTEEDYK
ncbi:hypothetical protein DNK47_02155 [Mycoplasma wenyonii]|uniref:Uncharacterized protein n=1 Tax=Mycoplasma wenyonii TaxID=65123 RepID=A0A328PPW1_9MOLU|nr:hypothetical protein [Mycoplasma wenyonii]RAO94998.1 hypothetical protein DNK47_02155 [Mycoplasma wenyonii]